MKNIAIIYHMFPHYRAGIIAELGKSDKARFLFYGDQRSVEGIIPIESAGSANIVHAPYFKLGPFLFQPMAIRLVLTKEIDSIIFLASMNFVSTWIAALLCRITGKKCYFWAHGWLSDCEPKWKRAIRNIFFRISKKVLVYGERSKAIGIRSGYPAERISVIYNSLDFAVMDAIYKRILNSGLKIDSRLLFEEPQYPLAVCSARLTTLCKFNLLLEAANLLKDRGTPINILLIGDGPERFALEEQSRQQGLSVVFYGQCYDENTLADLLFSADVTVSPGKIGLSAIHSLTYGTPCITHGDFNRQMPEAEAISEGVTGSFFAEGSATSLADAIETWLKNNPNRDQIRNLCRAEVIEKWNPIVQRNLIESSIV